MPGTKLIKCICVVSINRQVPPQFSPSLPPPDTYRYSKANNPKHTNNNNNNNNNNAPRYKWCFPSAGPSHTLSGRSASGPCPGGSSQSQPASQGRNWSCADAWWTHRSLNHALSYASWRSGCCWEWWESGGKGRMWAWSCCGWG